MKTAFIIILLTAIGYFGFFNHQNPVTTEIILFEDVTDEYISKPQASEIHSLFNFSGENKWNGAVFRYSILSDVSLNSISEIKVNAENQWLSNEIERDREIKKFNEKVSQILSKKDSIGKNHSSVYLPLAKELKRLSESKSQRRVVIIYSDLMENDPEISLYDKKEFALLKSDPDSLEKIFEGRQPLPSLSGIEIYIVYRPSDVAKDAEFKVVSEILQKDAGAKGSKSKHFGKPGKLKYREW